MTDKHGSWPGVESGLVADAKMRAKSTRFRIFFQLALSEVAGVDKISVRDISTLPTRLIVYNF
jgi:hypothetical protein